MDFNIIYTFEAHNLQDKSTTNHIKDLRIFHMKDCADATSTALKLFEDWREVVQEVEGLDLELKSIAIMEDDFSKKVGKNA